MFFVLSRAWEKKKFWDPMKNEPQTFGFRAPILYHWAHEDSVFYLFPTLVTKRKTSFFVSYNVYYLILKHKLQFQHDSPLTRTNTWAVCPLGYFLRGFYRNDGAWLHHIELGKCCKPNTFPDRYEDCYTENVRISFDKRGLSQCKRQGYYLAGIYKGGCDKLFCIESFKCCKMNIGEKQFLISQYFRKEQVTRKWFCTEFYLYTTL